MKSDELKSLQSPLKQKYKTDPDAALITLKTEGMIGGGVTCKIETGRVLAEAGLHPATGGNGLFACSGDMLLEALAACAGVTMSAVATSIGIEIRSGKVIAEGDIDFRGTLTVSKEVPVGLQNIRVKFELDTDAGEEEINTLIKLTERYCVVYQTLKNPPDIHFSVLKSHTS
jgi:uncharacterized OsmC-like protein